LHLGVYSYVEHRFILNVSKYIGHNFQINKVAPSPQGSPTPLQTQISSNFSRNIPQYPELATLQQYEV